MRTVLVRHETWAVRRSTAAPGGARPAADVVLVEIREGAAVGRGECAPSARDRERGLRWDGRLHPTEAALWG